MSILQRIATKRAFKQGFQGGTTQRNAAKTKEAYEAGAAAARTGRTLDDGFNDYWIAKQNKKPDEKDDFEDIINEMIGDDDLTEEEETELDEAEIDDADQDDAEDDEADGDEAENNE